ncbi:sulfotransferase [Novosphingobium panipatense]|uniref:sulfotransferase n=1 Tax=Novosphingobium panipatense TaxID=428991 RepID=UPI0036065B31
MVSSLPANRGRADPLPLFGVGLPRTGSSALSFLLSSDPEIRYLRVWESAQPCPPPSTVKAADPRRGASASAVDETLKGGRRTPTGIDGAMECQDLMALDFRSQIFQAFAQIPSYSEWLIEADLAGTYRYERRVLKLLQWGSRRGRGVSRLLLTCFTSTRWMPLFPMPAS